MTHLALAWAAKNPNVSTVILGASKPEQGTFHPLLSISPQPALARVDHFVLFRRSAVTDNLKAIKLIPKLTPEIMADIEKILDNTVSRSRPLLFARRGIKMGEGTNDASRF